MKLSIIIPVYNTAQFLDRCIESIYKDNPLNTADFEVICVNDGSTDKSQEKLDQYAAKYSNFTALVQFNQGQSAARNRAMEIASGDYLYFLDSDDTLNAAALFKALINGIHHDAGLITVDHIKVDEKGNVCNRQDKNVYKDLPELISGAELLYDYSVRGSIWSYIYDRSLIEDRHISFTEGVYHEDEEFIIKYICSDPMVYNSRQIVYYYTQREGSTVNPTTDLKKKKLLNDLLYVGCSISDMIMPDQAEIMQKGLSRKVSQIAIGFLIRLRRTDLEKKEKEALLRKFISSSLYPIKTTNLKLSHKLFSLIANTVISVIYERNI